MSELTARQREIYEFIAAFIREHGYPPTRREIGQRFDLVTAGVNQHLWLMEKKRAITVTPNTARGIRLLMQPA